MRTYASIEEQVDADFTRARHRAFLHRMGARLRGNPYSTSSLSFEEVRKTLGATNKFRLGRKVVPVERIVGSVGRYRDFDQTFLPAKASVEKNCGQDELGHLLASLLESEGLFLSTLAMQQEHRMLVAEGGTSPKCSITQADKAFVLGEPKTKDSSRTIRLTKGTISALKAHLSRQLEEIEEMGSLYQPGGLIFATEVGTTINPPNPRNRSFRPLLKCAGLPSVHFHGLRHNCATLLLSKNDKAKVVSERLGQSSISITLDIYSHLLPDMQEKAVKALEEMLS